MPKTPVTLTDWIHVDDDLPEWFVNVLIYTDTGEMSISFRTNMDKGAWKREFYGDCKVKWWAPLPEPPE